MSNVRRVPSCYPCGYAAQFGVIECRECRHNDGGSFATATEMSKAAPALKAMNENLDRRYTEATASYRTPDRGSLSIGDSSPGIRVHTEPIRRVGTITAPVALRRRRLTGTAWITIIAFLWLFALVAAQARSCVATTPQAAAMQQVEAMAAGRGPR